MDLLEATEKGRIHKHFLDYGSEEEQEGLMDSNCIQYRVNSEGSIPLRLVSEAEPTSQSNTVTSNVQAVLASPLNGQFYVIGSPTDVLGSVGQRSIAPRTFALEGAAPTLPSKEEKQGNRRATHNEVERRRRDNINHWIMKLGKLIPAELEGADSAQSGKHAQSKGGILAKACEYLAETRSTNESLRESLKSMEDVSTENERLNAEVHRLQRENEILRQQLQGGTPNSTMLKSEMEFNM